MSDLLGGAVSLGGGKRWTELRVGDRFRTARRTISETDLVNFVALAGFHEPLFLDAAVATDGGSRGRVLPGALTYSLAEGLVLQTRLLHGTGVAFLRMDLSVLAPAFVGDTIEVLVEITESRPSSKVGCGIVGSRNSVFNQHGDVVMVYTPVRLVRG